MDKHSGLRVSLVLGNHDRHLPIDFHPQLEMVKEKSVGDIRLVHEPSSAAQHPSISGHIHPTFYLRGKAKQGLKFPCFYLQERQIILPAFGRFTGGYKIKPSKGSRVVINSGTNLQLLNF
jgi:metallophosphoesterase superfamily enzyme